MKTIAIETETRPLAEWLPLDDSEEVVYLMKGGRAKFVIVPLDEGDGEVLAMQKNDRFMAHLAECVERARQGPVAADCLRPDSMPDYSRSCCRHRMR